ncbi:hypothetical protein GF385_04525 [Candidatus Dependentiae bacterium]|nr:hypothetical protein [Candidatus Dependentiae bacterium]
MKKIILTFLLISQISFVINAKLKIPSLNKIKNKIEKEFNRATKLTKENFNKFIKKTDDFVFNNKKDIFNFITIPKEELEKETQKELEKFNWAKDQKFFEKFSNSQNKDEKLKILNEKILKLHPDTKMPILVLGKDINDETEKLEKLSKKIEDFIKTQESKKGFLDFLSNNNNNSKNYFYGLNLLEKRINKMKENLENIATFLNELF